MEGGEELGSLRTPSPESGLLICLFVGLKEIEQNERTYRGQVHTGGISLLVRFLNVENR